MSLRAYQKVAQRAETPRDAEYRLFAEITRALIEIKSTPREQVADWADTLDWNRRLWTTLAAECRLESNGLPDATRAQIISLAMWVRRHTSAVLRREEDIDALIDINRAMMQGLSGQAEPV
ncbi:MAG: flagellar biosynthesis regulator FlaF [Caulobacteraceae bacterium]|nr:flagellar biosynthesis regulator FlaF [Caulobacteraceae bacterium]